MQQFESGEFNLPPLTPPTVTPPPPVTPPFSAADALPYATARVQPPVARVSKREGLWPSMGWPKHLIVAVLLGFIIGMAYRNSYESGMTLDNKYIIEEYYKAVFRNNPEMDPKSWIQVWQYFKNDYWWPKGISGLYRPLTSLSYWFDYVILTGKATKVNHHGVEVKTWNGRPLEDLSWAEYSAIPASLNTDSYHTINLIVHWTNAMLIYFVSLALIKRLWPAAFVAALFALHPITTESVTNIIGRADMLAAAATFGGLLIYMRSRQHSDSWALPWLVGLALITAFGVFSKESAAAAVLVLIVYDITISWRLDKDQEASMLRVLARGTPFFLGMVVITLLSSVIADVNEFGTALSKVLRLGMAAAITGIAVVQYIGVVLSTPSWTARFASAAGALLAMVIATLIYPYLPILGIFAIVLFEILHRMILTAKAGKLAPLPLLVLHGLAYLTLIGFALGIPVVISKIAKDHHLVDGMPVIVRGAIAMVVSAIAVGIFVYNARASREFRLAAIAGATALVAASCVLLPFIPVAFIAVILGIELFRGTLTSDNSRFKVVAHAALYLPLFFGMVGLPILALYFFRVMGWDTWRGWYIRYPAAIFAMAGGLALHFISIKADRVTRLLILLAIGLLSIIASYFSYWPGIMLMLVVALHEVILGTLTPQTPEYRRDWKIIWHRFAVGYLAMLPAIIAMFAVRAWVFANATPPEEPFLDNPIRGIWKVQELNIPSFAAELAAKPLLGMSYFECKMTAIKIMGRLLMLLTWPQNLCSDYSYSEIPNFSYTFKQGWHDVQAILALIALLGIAYLAYKLYTRNRPAFFMIGFFFAASLPTSNFFLTIGSVMAERFMYLPLMGFTGIVALGVFALAKKIFETLKVYDEDDFPWYSVIPSVLLSIVLVVYGIRTYLRNPVWKNDRALWEDAITKSPNAFRCYQSLAFALYEEGLLDGVPARNVDRRENGSDTRGMIALDEAGIKIVSKLPNQLNSSRMYLHLGMYYQLKADTLCTPGPNETLQIPPEAIELYKKSILTLEDGIKVDRAFNELNKIKQKNRGDPPELINDAGLGPIYGTLAMAYARLGMTNEALLRLYYGMQLDPTDADNYARLGMIQFQNRDYDNAAIGMIQAVLLDGARNDVWGYLPRAYLQLNSPAAILTAPGGRYQLNTGDPRLNEHMFEAYRRYIRTFLRAQRYDLAEETRQGAKKAYPNWPHEELDKLFYEPIPLVTPFGLDTANARPPRGIRPKK